MNKLKDLLKQGIIKLKRNTSYEEFTTDDSLEVTSGNSFLWEVDNDEKEMTTVTTTVYNVAKKLKNIYIL